MKFRKLALGTVFAIAAVAGVQSITHASTRYDFIAHQAGLQATQPQASQAKAVPAITLAQAGQTSFNYPPRLVRTAASQISGNTPSTYEFTLTVPENAGQPLKAIAISQADNLETIHFDVSGSKAFAGGRYAAGPEIPLASIGGTQPAKPGEITVVFDRPVQPGSTVTVAIAAAANPNFGGTYEFGVTAYPVGENGLGQFLGYGRINFYSNSN